jgi:RNase P subunit RPR2
MINLQMASKRLCFVDKCRFSGSHVVPGHICGLCGIYGHGQGECGDDEAIALLIEKFGGDIMPIGQECTSEDCLSKNTHDASAHRCKLCCGVVYHTLLTCPESVKAKHLSLAISQLDLLKRDHDIGEVKDTLKLQKKQQDQIKEEILLLEAEFARVTVRLAWCKTEQSRLDDEHKKTIQLKLEMDMSHETEAKKVANQKTSLVVSQALLATSKGQSVSLPKDEKSKVILTCNGLPDMSVSKDVIKAESAKLDTSPGYDVECPTCEQINRVPEGYTVSNDNKIDCSRCLDKAQIRLPKCRHFNMCETCFQFAAARRIASIRFGTRDGAVVTCQEFGTTTYYILRKTAKDDLQVLRTVKGDYIDVLALIKGYTAVMK